MERNAILTKIDEIISNILNHHDYILSESLLPEDVTGWDSLVTAMVISSIEQEFQIKMKFSDLLAWHDLGQLVTIIENKLK